MNARGVRTARGGDWHPTTVRNILLRSHAAQPLGNSNNGGPETQLPCILPIKSPEKMAVNARQLVDQGVKHLKIKVHGNVKEEVACVAAIREEVGADIHLTIYANQSYT